MSCMQKMKRKGQSGITMMSLVITIIVVIILATIFIPATSQMPDEANYAKFAEEVKNVEEGVQQIRLNNAYKGDTEEKINTGFKKVTLKNAPADFQSFDKNGLDVTGYVVDLEEIKYENAEFGNDYEIEKSELEFTKDDVYVYDSTGTVYYVKGTYYQGEIIHTVIAGSDMGLSSTEDGPIISNIIIASGELSDGTPTKGKAKIIVSAFPRFGGELTVMVREFVAEKQPDETFATQVSRNGVYTVVVTEENGGRTVRKIYVDGIVESSKAPSNLSIIVNDGDPNVRTNLVDVVVRADGATHMMITKNNPLKPTSSDSKWEKYKTNFTYDLGSVEGRVTLYAWFKDEFSNVTDSIVKATIVYDKTAPTNTPPTLVTSGPYIIVETNQTDNISPDVYLLSTTEYGYKVYGNPGEYTWGTNKLIGPLQNNETYEFVTRTTDEVGNATTSMSVTHGVSFDYTINFDLNGGIGTMESVYTKENVPISIPSTIPEREGYTFIGWSENKNAAPTDISDIYYVGESYLVTGNETNKTLYAIWAARTDMTYTVNHYVEKEGTVGEYELILTETFNDGTVGDFAVAKSKAGEAGVFEGFVENTSHSQRVGSAEVKGNGSTVLSLYYYRARYDLYVKGENATTVGTRVEVPYETEVTISAVPAEGYVFDKWYIEGTEESSPYYLNFVNEGGNTNPNAVFKMIGKTTTIIAKTKLKKYSITYELNGGTTTGVNPTEYAKDTPAFTLYNPVKNGYNFNGWTGTDLIQPTQTVTVDPSKLVNIVDRKYEAVFEPTEELLTITADPTEPTNDSVRVIVSCIDKDLRLEYRIGTIGNWDMYASSLEITENTTIYARALKDGVVIDEETLVIDNIDKENPVISDVSISDNWVEGRDLKVKVTASDDTEIYGYAISNSDEVPDVDDYTDSNDELELEEGINYVWVRDIAGNTTSHIVYAWDISSDSNKKIYALFKDETHLVLKGEGNTKSYEVGNTPYEALKENVADIKIEGDIESIGNYVLSNMENAKTISISEALKELKENAIVYTNKYDKIEVATGNTNFVYENYALYNVGKTELYAHSSSDQSTEFVVPDSVTEIKKAAFYENNDLSSIKVTSNPIIRESAFEECKLLYQIVGSIGGKNIDARAFYNCSNLHVLTISDELETIGELAFYNTNKLGAIEIPKTVTNVVDEFASKNEVFKYIGALSGNQYNKGIVRYYQSSDAMYSYAHKYPTEAHFELIDDVMPEVKSLNIISPETGTYAEGQEIVFEALFSETLGINADTVVPELKIKIGDGVEKVVGRAKFSGDRIIYTYVVESDDYGKLNFVSCFGTIIDTSNNSNTIEFTELGGSEIYIDTVVRLLEKGVTTFYGTIQQALDAAATDGTTSVITLLKDTNESVKVVSNKNIILSLNNNVFNNTGSNYSITNNGKIEISGPGTITASTTIVMNRANATMKIASASVICLSNDVAAIINESAGDLSITNTTIKGNAIAIDAQGKVSLYNNEIITTNGTTLKAGANSEITVDECNITAVGGYGVNVVGTAVVNLNLSEVLSETSSAINNQGNITVNNSTVTGFVGINTTGNTVIKNSIIEGTDVDGASLINAGTTKMFDTNIKTEVGTAIQNRGLELTAYVSKVNTSGDTKDAIVNYENANIILKNTQVQAVNGRAILNEGNVTLEEESQVSAEGALIVENIGTLINNSVTISAPNVTSTALLNKGVLTGTSLKINSEGLIGIQNATEGLMTLSGVNLDIQNDASNVIGIENNSSKENTVENSIIYAKSSDAKASAIVSNLRAKITIDTSTLSGDSSTSEGYGIINNQGTITVGNLQNLVSEETPYIEGSYAGYYSDAGNLKFYDGIFVGQENKSIYGTVTDKPAYSYVLYTLIDTNLESAILKVDQSAPTGVILEASTTEWSNKTIILTGKAQDADSGIWKYAITNSPDVPSASEWIEVPEYPLDFETTLEVTETNTFYLHVMDRSENKAVSEGVSTKYDVDLPVIEKVEISPDVWTSGDVTITVKASDHNSGISGYEFSKTYHDLITPGDGYTSKTPEQEATITHIVEINGTIHIYVYDQAGNAAYQSCDIDNIDKTLPTINIEFYEYDDNVTRVKVTGIDNESGVRAIYMNGVAQTVKGSETEKFAICEITQSGVHEFMVEDNVSNKVFDYLETYEIMYDPIDASGTMPYQVKIKDLAIPLLENRFEKPTFDFIGWNTERNYTGIKYNAKQEYTENRNTTLYAMWKDVTPPDIVDVWVSDEWDVGERMLLEIKAIDNVLPTGYAITTSTTEPTTWNVQNKAEITLGNDTYYVWVKDDTGNSAYEEVKIYDLSETSSPNTVVAIVKDFEQDDKYIISIEGEGAVKDLDESAEKPWEEQKDKITEIIVDDGVTTIGENVLADLTNVDSIKISATVTSIALNTFVHTNNYSSISVDSAKFIVVDGMLYDAVGPNLYISSTKLTLGDIVLSSEITNIAPYAFENSAITTLCLGNNSDILEGTFYNAKNLTKVYSATYVGGKSIGNRAFEGCTSLTTLNISDELETIGTRAFYGTNSLTNITIPKTLTSISGYHVFVGIGTKAGTDTGKGYVYYYDSNTPMRTYATSSTTKDQATFIGIDDIPPEVSKVLINNNEDTTRNEVVSLKITASDNRKVTEMFITEDATINPRESAIEWSEYSSECEFELTKTTGVHNVYVWVKDAAGNISETSASDSIILVIYEIEIVGGTEKIQYVDLTGSNYYEYREKGYTLEGDGIDVEITGNVRHTSVGTYNINYIVSYMGYHMETITKTVYIIANSWNTTGITEGDFTFVTHTSGKYAKVIKYNGASTPATLTIPETFTYNGEEYKVIDVGDGNSAIVNTDSTVGKVVLGNNVIAVSANAFSTFKNISNIEYSDNMMTFGEYSFANSNSIYSKLTLKENVREVKEGAFSNNTIDEIVINDGVKSIEAKAFYTLKGEMMGKTLEIPKSIDNISPLAFYGNKFEKIVVDSENNIYSDIDNIVLVSENETELYQYALGTAQTEYVVPNGITIVEAGAFAESENLTKVTLSDSVVKVNEKAFKNIENMTSIENTSQVSILGAEAFENTPVSNFEFSNDLEIIEERTFKKTNIKEAHLQSNVNTIKSEAFANNSKLEKVVIVGEAKISGNTFKDSMNLKYLVALPSNKMLGLSETLEIASSADLYVTSEELEKEYEADANWGVLDTYRIKLLAELIGGKEIGLVDKEVYSELGVTLLGEDFVSGNGTSSIIPEFSVELESGADNSVNGVFTNIYYVRYNGEVVMILERVVRILDTEPPVIHDIVTSSNWELGTVLKLDVIATDNRDEVLNYAVTKTADATNAKWVQNPTVTISNTTSYVHVKDEVGNLTTIVVKAWDISKNSDKTLYAYLKQSGELVFSGTGTTKNVTFGNASWKNDKTNITKVTIEEGIISLGDYILSNLENVSEIYISSMVGNSLPIATTAFAGTTNFNNITIAAGNTGLIMEDEYTLTNSDSTIIYLHSRKDPATTYTISDNREIIAEGAFYKNNNLQTIEMNKLVEIKRSAFEGSLNLKTINGEIGNTEIGSYAFSGDINLQDITISKTVTKVGKGIFTNVLGPVRYYASCSAMKTYAKTYPDETNFVLIDDVFPTDTKPTVKLSSSTIVVISKQEDIDTGIVTQEYILRLDGEEYNDADWQTQSYYTGLVANQKYYVKTRATDGAGNVTVSKETEATTKKVPESITLTAVPSGPTSGDVTVIVEWPVEDMEALYGEGWPAGTTVTKQIGIKNPGSESTTWTNITDDNATYTRVFDDNGYVIYARLFDGYNYTAQTKSLSINNIDRIAPTGTVFINNNDEEALENAVKLKLSATDNRNDTGFGVKYYYASESPTLDLATAEWKAYTGAKEYDFTLTGTTSMKTVYVWFKDAAENISAVASDEVLLITDNVRLEQDGVTTYYLSLVDAINATNDNPTTPSKITIIRNISQDGPYVINSNKNIVIDMRSNDISYTGTGQIVLIRNSGLLSIMTSRTKACGLYAVSNDGEAICIWNDGHVEVVGVSLSADSPTGNSTGILNKSTR